MRTLTPYLSRFVFTAAVLALIFRYYLTEGVEQKNTYLIAILAILYAISLFTTGWYFGKKDDEYLPLLNVGLRFHIATFLVHNFIFELWFLFGLNAIDEQAIVVHLALVIWATGLILHYLLYLSLKRKTISGLDKEEIFE